MKNLFFTLSLISSLFLVTSCEKEVAPVTDNNSTSQTREIKVDYAMHSVSGKVELIALVQENGVLVEREFEILRPDQTITFYCKSGQYLMVKARNLSPSHDEVIVSIYVDGILFSSNSTTAANGWAMASGTPN